MEEISHRYAKREADLLADVKMANSPSTPVVAEFDAKKFENELDNILKSSKTNGNSNLNYFTPSILMQKSQKLKKLAKKSKEKKLPLKLKLPLHKIPA